MSHVTKNYNTDGGDRTVIGGVLEFAEGAQVRGFPGAENMVPDTSNTAAKIRDDLNTLILNLKNAGVMIPTPGTCPYWRCPRRRPCPPPRLLPTAVMPQ